MNYDHKLDKIVYSKAFAFQSKRFFLTMLGVFMLPPEATYTRRWWNFSAHLPLCKFFFSLSSVSLKFVYVKQKPPRAPFALNDVMTNATWKINTHFICHSEMFFLHFLDEKMKDYFPQLCRVSSLEVEEKRRYKWNKHSSNGLTFSNCLISKTGFFHKCLHN